MKSLGELIGIIKGEKAESVFPKPIPGGNRYLQIEDLRDNTHLKYAISKNGALSQKTDVLIAWDGANAGTVGYGLEGYIGSTLAILRPQDKNIYTPFLGLYLGSKFAEINRNTTGATIPHVNREYLEALPVPLPPLPEQQRIAAILQKADRLRRLRRYARQLSDTFLQSVFLEMFYRQEVRNWPKLKVAEMVKKGANTIRTGPFGSQLLHSEFVDEGIVVLGIDNVVTNCFTWGKPRFITNEKYQQLKRYTVFPGDVVVTIMGTNGHCAIIPDSIPLAINTKHLCCISLDKTRCLPEFFHQSFLNHPSILTQMGISQRGAVMPGLNMGLIKELLISLPPINLQKQFSRFVKRYNRIDKTQIESERQSEHLFQSLLQRAFQGEL